MRHRPEELSALAAKTRFSKKEIQMMYRGFKQECPTGYVDEEAFKQIFSQFFPQGGKFLLFFRCFEKIVYYFTGLGDWISVT